MARDLDAAIGAILTDLNRGSDYSARVREAIVDAIALYTPKRFAFNTTVSSLSWSQSVYQAAPPNWLAIDYLRLLAATYREPLTAKSSRWMNDQDRAITVVTGPPRFYCIEARLVRVYPSPDMDYQVAVAYHQELTEVSLDAGGGATNAWLTEGWPLIKAEATIDLIENYLGGDEMSRLPGLMNRRQRWLDANMRRVELEQATGSLEPYL